jgi:hypothetical protein
VLQDTRLGWHILGSATLVPNICGNRFRDYSISIFVRMNILRRAGIELMFNRLFQDWQRVNVMNAGLVEKLEYILASDAFVGDNFAHNITERQTAVMFQIIGKNHLLCRDDSDNELDVVDLADPIHFPQQSERNAHAFLDGGASLIEPFENSVREERLADVLVLHNKRCRRIIEARRIFDLNVAF